MTQDPADLERQIDRAFRQLPAPRAPRTLLPRVLAAADAPARHAARPDSWFTWPRAWQAASLAASALLVTALVWGWPVLQALIAALTPAPLHAAGARVSDASETVVAVATVVRLLWQALVQPFVEYVLIVIVVMCGACAAFGAALSRVALGEASQS